MNLTEPGGDLASPHPRPALLAVEGRDTASSKLLPLKLQPRVLKQGGTVLGAALGSRFYKAMLGFGDLRETIHHAISIAVRHSHLITMATRPAESAN